MIKKSFYLISGLILLGALSRLLPHAYNFTPIGAIVLFGAAYFKDKKWALIVPVFAIWLSDLFLNNLYYSSYYDGFVFFTSGFLYIIGAILLIAFLGMFLLKKITAGRVFLSAVGGSVLFFIVSNFGVWISGTLYPLTAEGLLMCYVAAIPFFHNTLAGTLVYSAALFGGYEYLKYRIPELQPSHAYSNK